MNAKHISNFEQVALQFAEEIIVNEDKRDYFLKGAKWAVEAIESTIANSGHPMASDSDNAKFSEWTLRDIKKAIRDIKNAPAPRTK